MGGQFGLVQLDGSQAYQQGLVHALILKVKVKVFPISCRCHHPTQVAAADGRQGGEGRDSPRETDFKIVTKDEAR